MGVWSSIGRRNQIGILTVLVLLVVTAAAGGCQAHQRPGALTAEEQRLLTATPLPYTVSVVPWNADPRDESGRDPGAYARGLADLINESGAFQTSRFASTPAADADLIAISTGMSCNTSVIPVFTILSAGLIPTVFDDEDCQGLIVRSARPSPSPPVELSVRHKGRVVVGWAALVFGAMPGWSWGTGVDDRRYGERLRLEVVRHRAEIDNLVAGSRPATAPVPSASAAPQSPPQ